MGGNKGASRVAPLARVVGCDTWRLLGGGSEIGDDKVKAARMIQSRCNLDSGALHGHRMRRTMGRTDGGPDEWTDKGTEGRTDGPAVVHWRMVYFKRAKHVLGSSWTLK